MPCDDPEAVCVRVASSPNCCGIVVASPTVRRAAYMCGSLSAAAPQALMALQALCPVVKSQHDGVLLWARQLAKSQPFKQFDQFASACSLLQLVIFA